MSMVKNLVNKPLAVMVIATLILAVSIYMSSYLKQALTPEIEIPLLIVQTTYTGASPQAMEESVTKILESALLNVSGIKNITSTSSEGQSSINLEFDWGSNLDQASLDVRDKIDRVQRKLPDDASTPTVIKLDMNAQPIMTYTVTGGDRSVDEILTIVEDQFVPYIERVDGVSSVTVTGGRSQQVRVEVLQNRLDAYNLIMTSISSAIQLQNVDVNAGNIEQGNQKLLVRTSGSFESLDDIRRTVITYKTVNAEANQVTVPVFLQDVANVFLGYEKESTYSQVNQQDAINIQISKSSDANTVRVAKLLKEQMPSIEQRLPTGMTVKLLRDSSVQIANSINGVISAAVTGVLLTMAILLLFLRNLHSAIIISIVLPLSIFVTLLGMYFFGISLNIISLAGLTLSIGMIVDSSIVIIENITKYREKGIVSKTAAVLGTREVVNPVIAGVLTTVCVFLPLIMLTNELGMTGMFVKDLSFTIVIALISSLCFSIVINPVLAASYLPIYTTKQRKLSGILAKIDQKITDLFAFLDNHYASAVEHVLYYKKFVLLAVFGLVVLSVVLFKNFIGMQGMPRMQSDTIVFNYTMPIGTTLEQTKAVGQELVSLFMKDVGDSINYIVLSAGRSGRGSGGVGSYKGNLSIVLPDYNERTLETADIQQLFRSYYAKFPGVDFGFTLSGTGGSSNAVSLKISGSDYNQLTKVSTDIVDILNASPKLLDAETDNDDGLPQLNMVPNRSKAYAYGLSVSNIGNELAANLDGVTAGTYTLNGDEIDIKVILREEDRSDTLDLERIFLNGTFNGQAARVPLSSVVSMENSTSSVSILRENQARAIKITASAAEGVSPSEASELASSLVKNQYVLPEGIYLESQSDFDDMKEMMPTLIAILIMAIAFVYAVMAAQFESLKGPFIMLSTLLTVPIGPVFIYLITGSNFSTLSAVGLILLVGIAVNNGIILVDYTNLLRMRGYKINDAIVESARSRLRPILMTSVSTILGMIPMAFFAGEGGSFTAPIGLTVLGGVFSSTIMTLFLVPTLYMVFYKNEGEKSA